MRHSLPCRPLAALLLALWCVPLAAAPRNLLTPSTFPLPVAGGNATLAWVRVPDAPKGTGPVLRITVHRPTDPFYLLSTGQTLSQPLAKRARLRLSFWGRSATKNPLRVILEKAGPPFTASLVLSPTLTSQWKLYTVTEGVAPFGAGEKHVRVQFGHQAGVIELAGLALEDLGPDREMMAAEAAVAPDAVRKRIERYRRGNLTVVVRNSRGRPVRNARVAVQQLDHAFLFGCNIFGLRPTDTSPAQLAYQRRFTALLNYCTLPFYWGFFEPQKGQPIYGQLDAMARWCAAHGLAAKGHPLVWHEVYPAWAPTDPEGAIPLLRARVHDIIRHYRGTIRYWDVQNEANSSTAFAGTGVGAWVKRDGPAAVVRTTLGWAREASRGTGNTLVYNDYDTSEANVRLLEALAKHKALPDAIGIQSHMHGGNWPLAEVWQRAQRFARFGRPIHFTELTVLSGAPKEGLDMRNPPTDWPTTPEGEAAQADYLERFYRVLFSHPSVRAITYWDFSDQGAWLNAPSGLLRKDMSPKPAYNRLMRLVHGEWWTRVQGRANAAGRFTTRAYYGRHRVTVTDGAGRTVTREVLLPLGQGAKTLTLSLPGGR